MGGDSLVDDDKQSSKLAWDKIELPKPGFVERLTGKHFRKRAEDFITDSIKEHAAMEDGRVDDELADYIRKKLTQRAEVSMQRDVVEPSGWAILSGAATGAAAVTISKRMEGRAVTRNSVMATVAGTAVGAVLDLYRINRRFDCAMQGALSGALRAMQEERSPMAQERRAKNADYRPFDRDMEGFSR